MKNYKIKEKTKKLDGLMPLIFCSYLYVKQILKKLTDYE